MGSKRRLWRVLAMFAAFALVIAACGDDSDESSSDTTEAAEAEISGELCSEGSDGTLNIGTILPETGSLAFLGPPEFAGADLAASDINEAGGVLDADITLCQGDSGDTTTDLANQTVDRLLNNSVDAIIGAASSAVSFTVIDKITEADVIEFSPANTSPDFTDYEDNGLYFRTAPSDILQGQVLADLILEEGNASVGLMALEDPYGEGLLDFTVEPLTESGADVTNEIIYDPNAENFDAEVGEVAASDPDAIVVIGFEESAQILETMNEQGLFDKNIYLVDGNVGNALGEQVGADMTGIKGTVPSVELTDEFTDRLLEVDPDLVDFTYSAETYDAIVITALAAEVAGTDDPTAVAAEINGVTKDGTECTSFADCKELIAAGTDIDYVGQGGPYEFIDQGEPSAASFAILQYGADNVIDDDATVFRQAALAG